MKKMMQNLMAVAPFFFLTVEVITLICPEIWAEIVLWRHRIDFLYFVWIGVVGFLYLPKWALVFIIWTVIPSIFGWYDSNEGSRYVVASDAFLRFDAAVNMGFLLFEVLVAEVATRYFFVTDYLIASKNKKIVKLGFFWRQFCLNVVLRQLEGSMKAAGQPLGKLTVIQFIYSVYLEMEINNEWEVEFLESEERVNFSAFADETGKMNFEFSSSKRGIEVCQFALKVLRERGRHAAIDFVLNNEYSFS